MGKTELPQPPFHRDSYAENSEYTNIIPASPSRVGLHSQCTICPKGDRMDTSAATTQSPTGMSRSTCSSCTMRSLNASSMGPVPMSLPSKNNVGWTLNDPFIVYDRRLPRVASRKPFHSFPVVTIERKIGSKQTLSFRSKLSPCNMGPIAEPEIPYTDVLLVGAGFATYTLLNKLRRQGLSVKILERGASAGGIWYWVSVS